MENTRIQRIHSIFEEVNAIITNTHIVYASGKHGNAYLNKDAIYPHTAKISELCEYIAEDFKNYDIDAVMGPVVGGVVLSQWVAHHLSTLRSKQIFALYADKEEINGETNFVIKRGQEVYVTMKHILVVEDVLTTGTSTRKVIQAVRDLCGLVIGVGALCNRGGVTNKELGDISVFHTLMDISLDTYPENDCPLCKAEVPINIKVGKGADYLKKKKLTS